jgi:hypothetical protein
VGGWGSHHRLRPSARRFLADDLPLFYAIVGDLFPGVTVPTTELGELQVRMRTPQRHRHPTPPHALTRPSAFVFAQSAVNEQLALSGLQHVEGWNTKIMQARPTGTTGGGGP